MADLDQGDAKRYALQQGLAVSTTKSTGYPRSVVKLQSDFETVAANIKVNNNKVLLSDSACNIRFRINPSSLCPMFELGISLAPAPQNATKEQQDLSKKMRIAVYFAAYTGSDQDTNRQPHAFPSAANNEPSGPLSFSSHLKSVRFVRGNDSHVPQELLHEGVAKDRQLCFQWQASGPYVFNKSLPIDKLSQKSQEAAKKLKSMLEDLDKGSTIWVVTKNQPKMAQGAWPLFASLPSPVPQSYGLWVKSPSSSNPPDSIMSFPPARTFVIYPNLAARILGSRPVGWAQPGNSEFQDASVAPIPADGDPLPEVTHFRDGRQYLAYVLGGFAYENEHNKSTGVRVVNGDHRCDLIPQEDNEDRCLILLNIKPPTISAQSGNDPALPALEESVHITFIHAGTTYSLTGRVVRIPTEYSKWGRNVAIFSERDATAPRMGFIVQSSYRLTANFHFGHFGSRTAPTEERIMRLMTGQAPGHPGTVDFIKTLLLAQDSYNIARNKVATPALPANWRTTVDQVCNRRRLNAKQITAINAYFTQRVTLVRGPPGTGKSTLIDTIIELEQRFNQQFWVCTESNAAADVLVHKTVSRLGNINPDGLYRVRPLFQETLDIKTDDAGNPGLVCLPDQPPQEDGETPAQAIQRFLRAQENVDKAMSLSATIRKRTLVYADLAKKNKKEYDAMTKVLQAFKAYNNLRFEGMSAEQYLELQAELESQYIDAVRRLQQLYVAGARGIYSTAAAADGRLLRQFKPVGVIMDEASQFIEARAVSAILHAVEGMRFGRVILIGDDRQLPPTVLSTKTPFKNTTSVSLFERLIDSGFEVIMLDEQHRMHPTISRICRTAIYNDLGGLRDGPRTSSQGQAADAFAGFIQAFAIRNGNKNFPTKHHSAAISPVTTASTPFKLVRLTDSTSAINPDSARLVVRVLLELRRYGVEGKDILVLAFYAQQVLFLRAVVEAHAVFEGVTVSTVDGSQGSERGIVIIDTVTQGKAVGDPVAFLNADFRRFNVAMSRAQYGRIVIASEGMMASNEGGAKVWRQFWEEATATRTIIRSGALNTLSLHSEVETLFNDVNTTWRARAQQATEAVQPSTAAASMAVLSLRDTHGSYDLARFMEDTGASAADARRYLDRANGDMAVAVNNWGQTHEMAGEVEEIGRGG